MKWQFKISVFFMQFVFACCDMMTLLVKCLGLFYYYLMGVRILFRFCGCLLEHFKFIEAEELINLRNWKAEKKMYDWKLHIHAWTLMSATLQPVGMQRMLRSLTEVWNAKRHYKLLNFNCNFQGYFLGKVACWSQAQCRNVDYKAVV